MKNKIMLLLLICLAVYQPVQAANSTDTGTSVETKIFLLGVPIMYLFCVGCLELYYCRVTKTQDVTLPAQGQGASLVLGAVSPDDNPPEYEAGPPPTSEELPPTYAQAVLKRGRDDHVAVIV
jgi:hypothetical protein